MSKGSNRRPTTVIAKELTKRWKKTFDRLEDITKEYTCVICDDEVVEQGMAFCELCREGFKKDLLGL
jgi:hypothetical protein